MEQTLPWWVEVLKQAPSVIGVVVVTYLFLKAIQALVAAFLVAIQERDKLFFDTVSGITEAITAMNTQLVKHAQETTTEIGNMHRAVADRRAEDRAKIKKQTR